MGVKKFIKKSVAFVAAAAMALTMVVAPVGAGAGTSYAEGTGSITTDPVHVNKTAELQSDGTYKITLESYVTGDVTVDRTYTTTPCDIVLVLDQSGSMADPMSYTAQESKSYSYNDIENSDTDYYYKDGDSYYQVKTSRRGDWRNNYYYLYYQKGINTYYLSGKNVTQNPKDITDANDEIWTGTLYTSESSRLAALQRAANSFIDGVETSATKPPGVDHRIAVVGFASNSTLFIGNKQYNSNKASNQYGKALQSVKDNKESIKTSISNLSANGGTQPQNGLDMANRIFKAYEDNKDNTYTKEDGTTATRNKIIVVFTDGEPGDYGFNAGVAKSAISTASTSKTVYNAKVYSVGIFSGADVSDDLTPNYELNANKFMHLISSNYPNAKVNNQNNIVPGDRDPNGTYYKSASTSSELNNIFAEIAQDTVGGSASIALGKSAVSRDIISNDFELPAGITQENVKNYVNVSTVDYEGGGKWSGTKEPINDSAIITVDQANKTFNVSNFDFSENYVGEGKSQDGETKARGKKLVIEITGITAKHSGEDMKTNNTPSSTSGIYTGNDLVKKYNEPTVSIPDKSYVLDYGKTVVSNEVKNDCGISNVKLYSTAKPSPRGISTAGRYGTFDLTNVANGGTITYTPGKINWDGFDSVYVFGEKSENSTTDKYLWSAVNFIPASSVYYEDDFGKTDNKYSEIAIVWSGKDWSKAPDSTSTSTTDKNQSSKNEVYGWDDSYKENLGYSDGSATMTNTKGATATFTFTGTGVDVYSRTNGNVGLIRAAVYSGVGATNKDGIKKETVQSKYIDNVSTSGDYYQIPTLSFEDLDYGTYTVVITAGAKGKGKSGTYYLDGIRVYNPLKGNDTAEKAYDQAGDGESKAEYIKLRDTLIAKGFGTTDESKPGSVFIDSMNGEDSVIVGTEEDYTKYGPKNEVYLAKDQAVAFEIEGYANASIKPNVFIGLKALNEATSATITNGEGKLTKEIKSSSDLYYQVKPTSSGRIVIKNNTDKILSITKVRITKANNKPKLMATPELLSYVAGFDSLSETESSGINEDNKGDKESNLDKDDVEIDNPSDSTDSDTTDNDKQESNNSVWNRILNSLKNWFKK